MIESLSGMKRTLLPVGIAIILSMMLGAWYAKIFLLISAEPNSSEFEKKNLTGGNLC
jgi:hypothetical protein